jgi:lysozyme
MSQNRKLTGIGAAVLLSVWGFHEGNKLTPYYDVLGYPTVCMGHLLPMGADMTRVYSEAECNKLAATDLSIAQEAVIRHVRVPLTTGQMIALADFVGHFGETKFRNSTLLAKINSGVPVDQACREELPRWIYGKIAGVAVKLPGLVTRAENRIQFCTGAFL